MSVKLIPTEEQRAILEALTVPERIKTALNAPIVELDDEVADVLRDALSEELMMVGFDLDYELTPEGRLIEDLIDKLFVP